MHRSGPLWRSAPVAALLVLVSAGCSSSSAAGPSRRPSRLLVAATVAPVTDIVRQVVGDRPRLVGLVPEGVDSHTFEPSPKTVRVLAGADVLFMNGLHLEGSTLEQARANMPRPVAVPTSTAQALEPEARGSQIVLLGDLSLTPADYAFDATFPRDRGDPNPHAWMDPMYAKRWSEIVRDVMSRRDPAGAPAYGANQARFVEAIDHLDRAVATAVASIPEGHRKLLTYHDSFAYFSRRYGIPVVGAVQPSDFSEPSARDIRQLIEQVKAAGVPAVFGSEVFPSTVLRQVASEAHARYVDKLRDDELPGPRGAPQHTYLGMMVSDAATITDALGGDSSALRTVPTAATWRR